MAEVVHLLKSAGNKEYVAKCGETYTEPKGLKTGLPATITVWGSKVTCSACQPTVVG